MRVQVATPVGKVLDEDVRSVVLPTESGQTEILPGHARLLTLVTPGVGRLKSSDTETKEVFALSAGFCKVSEDGVEIISSQVRKKDTIDLKATQGDLEALDQEDWDQLSVIERERATEQRNWLRALINAAQYST